MFRISNAGVIDTYIYIYMYTYIYICAYFCTYLDLYNVSLQGNRIQTYSICTLLHLLIKEASQKSQPIHFLLSSCAIYTEKYCAYTYIYICIHSTVYTSVHIPLRNYRTSNAGIPLNVVY